jgi:hypothetical protein
MVAYLLWQYCAERLISRGRSRHGQTLVLSCPEGANSADSSESCTKDYQIVIAPIATKSVESVRSVHLRPKRMCRAAVSPPKSEVSGCQVPPAVALRWPSPELEPWTGIELQTKKAQKLREEVHNRGMKLPSQPASFHDRAQNLRRPFRQHRQSMPLGVRHHVASLGGIRVASVALAYFAAHYNTHYRLAFPRSSGRHCCLRAAKSPSQHHSPRRLRLHSVKTRSQCEKLQADVRCVAHQAV